MTVYWCQQLLYKAENMNGRRDIFTVTCSDLQWQVDALQSGQIGTQAKPDHLSFVIVHLQSARRAPLGDFRDTAGQLVSHRLGVDEWAAVVDLCVVCVHVRMDVVLLVHDCEVVSVGDETQWSKHGPLTACDWKIGCGVTGVDEWPSPVTEVQWQRGTASALAQFFKQIFGIPSGPDEVVGLRCFRALKTQSGVNWTELINVSLFHVPTGGLTEAVAPSSFVTRSSAEGPRDASCQLKSCQLPRNSAETTYTTSPDQIDGMKLEI